MPVQAEQFLRDSEQLPGLFISSIRLYMMLKATYRAECYGCSGQTDEAAVPGVRLMDLVCIVMAQLVHDLRYTVMVASSQRLADEAFELEGTTLSLVVEFVGESPLHSWVHYGGSEQGYASAA